MDQEQIIQQVSQVLNMDAEGSKEFLSSITTSELTSLISNLENSNIEEIERLFNHYKSNFDFNAELETEGYDASVEEMDDIDKEYEIRKAFDDLSRRGLKYDEAFHDIVMKYGLDDHELTTILKGPLTEYTSEYDAKVNEALGKIELLKKGKQVGGNIFKGLATNQVDQVQTKSLPSIGKIINRAKKLNAMDTMESYAKIRGYETIGLVEHELDIETMQDSIIEHELNKMFEAMKNKWHKRMYWRKRPKNIGLGTVGHPDFDHSAKLDPEDKIEVDDYGTIKMKELKDYIITQGKK